MKKQHTNRGSMTLTPAALAATHGAGGSIGGFGRSDRALLPSIGVGNLLQLAGGIGGLGGGTGLELEGGIGGGGGGGHDLP